MNLISAQKPLPGRLQPIQARPFGPYTLWAGSLFQLPFGYIYHGGEIAEYWFTPGIPQSIDRYIQVMLFCQDYPVIIRPFSFYETPSRPDVGNVPSYPERPPAILGTYPKEWLIHTADEQPTGECGATHGKTQTNGVQVSGYGFQFQLPNRGLSLGVDLAKCQLELDISTQGAVMAGREYYLEVSDPDVIIARAGILLESDYTQDMQDAGNILTLPPQLFPTGNLTTYIAGIFREVTIGT